MTRLRRMPRRLPTAAIANCFPRAFYLQDKLVCPDSVCGNWIIEPGETCDDGNTADGDGCDSECVEAGAGAR